MLSNCHGISYILLSFKFSVSFNNICLTAKSTVLSEIYWHETHQKIIDFCLMSWISVYNLRIIQTCKISFNFTEFFKKKCWELQVDEMQNSCSWNWDSTLNVKDVVNMSYFLSCHFLDIKASLSRELSRRLTEV